MAENKFKIKNGLDVQGAATLGSTLNVTGAITGNVTGQVSDISNHTTTQLTEGDNLYYTTARTEVDARAALSVNDNAGDGALTYNSSTGVFDYSGISDSQIRSKISVTDAGGDGSLAYDNGTGVITYTGPSAAEVRAHLSVTDAGGDGSLSYDNGTGVFTYTGPSAAEVRAHISGGTGVTVTNGEIAIGQAVETTSDVTFANVNISGNLQVSGTETIVSVDALSVSDALIHLADSNETSDTVDIGFIAHYSPDAGVTKQHTGFFRDANDGEWYLFGEYVASGLDTAPYDTTINRADASFELTALNASFLSGKYRGFDSDFTAKSTTELSEGTNLYYTTARANTDFDTRLATKSTTNLSEGTNLYYTSTRATDDARAALAGGDGLTYVSATGTFNVGAGNGIVVAADTVAVGAGDGITVNASDVALASTSAGAGMTYTTGVLDLVGADSGGITVAADNFGVDTTVVRTNGAQTIYGAKSIESPLTIANNTGINLDYASGTDSKLFRTTGGATQFEYYDNSFIFDAKGDHAFQVRNSTAAATLTHTPNSTVTSSTTTIEGSVDITGNMNASSIELDGIYKLNSNSTSTSSTTQTAIFTFDKTIHRSGRFFIQVTNSTDSTYHCVDVIILHDGTTSDILEYGTIFTGAAVEATFETDISGNDVRLLATPASADSMTFKVMANTLEV